MTKRKGFTLRSHAINSNSVLLKENTVQTKTIRDTFSIPQCDYNLIAHLRNQCLLQGIQTTKSEIVRAGLRALNGLTVDELKQAASKIEKVKTGRPKKL